MEGEVKPIPPKIWVVAHDLDWGMRGERRVCRYYFAFEPTPAEVRAAIELAGHKLRADWQEPPRSGVITMYEVDYQRQEPRYE